MKRDLRSASVALIFLLLAFCPAAPAQDYLYATGNPSFGVNIPIENGYINVANGNVHLELPLARHPQRGNLQLDERLVYDGRIWQIVDNGGNYAWQPTNVPNSMAGWRFVSGLPGNAPTPTVLAAILCDYSNHYSHVYSYSWTDNEGTPHVFDTSWELMDGACAAGEPETAAGYATDSSGYSISMSGLTDNLPSSIVVYDGDGNQVYPQPVDRFGNYWSTDGNGDLVDDLGRTPVTVTASGNQIVYSVLSFGGGHATYTVTTEPIGVSTSFEQSAVREFSGTLTAIQSIQLPDGSSYSFTYDGYGELAGMTLPSGGTVNLSYGNYQDSYQNENRWLRSYSGGHGSLSFAPWVISLCSASGTVGCQEAVRVTDATGNDTVYGLTLNNGAWNTATYFYSGPLSGGNLLASTATGYDFSQICTLETCSGSKYITAQSETTALVDVGLQKQTLYGYDSLLGKVTSVKQWDYYAGSPPSSPAIDTEYAYTGYDLTQVKVLDGGGAQVALTNYNFTATATPTSGIAGHGGANPAGLPAPYLGSIVQWAGGSNYLTTTLTSDDTGTQLSGADPNGQTSFSHDSTDTYVTTVTPPTPSSGVSLPQSAAYDPSTGLPVSITDPNGAQTAYSSYDWAGRIAQINYPDGGSESFTNYSPVDRGDSRTMNSATSTQTRTLVDGYGRLSRIAVYNGQSANQWYQADYCYDANGRLQFESYRYQGNGWDTAQVCSGAGDAYSYDALGRLRQVLHGDGTSISYQHTGRATEVTDENGVQRIVQTDGLGRTAAVCEISSNSSMPGSGSPSSCGTDIAGTGFLTSYAYSLADHKTTVTQGAQTRTFETDPLGRTIFTQEPESGSTNYGYAYNSTGLVVTRTRPQANQANAAVLTTTTTQYDAVGRVVSVGYSDGITPNKAFTYDAAQYWDQGPSATYLKGRLAVMGAATTTGADHTGALFSYDAMGRVIGMWQCGPSICGTASQGTRYLGFSYDQAGNLIGESDPSSGAIVYNRSPAGEVTSIVNQSYTIEGGYNPGVDNPLVPSVENGPFGPTSYDLANGLGVAVTYDSLGRLNGTYVCSGSPQVTCSGEPEQYAFWVARQGDQLKEACYGPCAILGYDEFNRLTSSNLNSGQQAFSWSYDRYGNRWAQNVTSGSGPSWSTSFNAQTNQINKAGYAYDAAGNLVNDGTHSYQYDAEGNVLSVDAGNTAGYVYDAMNRRVGAATGAGNNEFSYDYAGRRISTWPASTAAPTVTVSCAPNPLPVGAAATCTVQVPGGSGTVALYEWSNYMRSATLDSSGTAIFADEAAGSPVQQVPLTIEYSGDSNFSSGSGTTTLNVVADPVTPAVAVSCAPNPLPVGIAATCTVHVPGGSGTVALYEWSNYMRSATLDSSGTAIFADEAAGSPVQQVPLTMQYSGDSHFSAGSGTTTLNVISGTSTPTVTVSCSPGALVSPQTTACTAQVSGGATGTAVFSVLGSTWQTLSLDGSGSATATGGFVNASPGSYTVQVDYSGDSSFNPATGSGVVTVSASSTGPEGRIYWDGEQIAFRSDYGFTYFEHQDWLGTERARTDPWGAVQAGYSSLAFGDGSTQTAGGTAVSQDNNSYTSLELDPETGSYHAQVRQYGPSTGSWMSPDPYAGSYDMNNPQSFNRYSYVDNNPLTFTDPSGEVTNGEYCDFWCDFIEDGVEAAADALLGLFDGGKPAFHGSLEPRPATPGAMNAADDDGLQPVYTFYVSTHPWVLPSHISFLAAFAGTAPNKGNVFTCGAAAAQKVSIAGGLNALGIGAQGGVDGFLTNALGGNVFSGATGLFTGGGSMADVAFGGTRLGVPGGSTNLENGISGVVQNGVARGAFAAISAGSEITTLTGTASTVGLTAGEYASGVGEVKFAYDFSTYAGSVAGCAAGIIH